MADDQAPARIEPELDLGDQPTGPRLVSAKTGLQARNLGKQYKKRPVVRGVSLSVQRGEAVGLLGPNGAGKTTCFYMITGLVAPDYGSIVLDGVDITRLPMYRRARLGIGYLPQEASIFRGMTVEGNIRSVLEVVEPDRYRRETMLEELLAEFSIEHLRRTLATALSGGERRRCEIARALASQPAFILLDEPLAGIDPICSGAHETIGRPHVADALARQGLVKNRKEAFKRFLAKDKPGYVESMGPAPAEAIALIRDAGGVACLAHPQTAGPESELEALRALGLDGVEVHYAAHSPSQVRAYGDWAAGRNLIACGGSDYHGPGTGREGRLGVEYEDAQLGPLLERLA